LEAFRLPFCHWAGFDVSQVTVRLAHWSRFTADFAETSNWSFTTNAAARRRKRAASLRPAWWFMMHIRSGGVLASGVMGCAATWV